MQSAELVLVGLATAAGVTVLALLIAALTIKPAARPIAQPAAP